jgi:uncharacterized protein DUF5681
MLARSDCCLHKFGPTMTDSSDDGVGYRRPPRRTQFKKGASGNPKGRPKRTKSFAADLTSELQETLILTENGKPRRVTKQRAFIKTLTAAAIKKDIRAINALLACLRYFGLETEEQVAPSADPGDLEILESYIAREKQRTEAGVNPSAKSKKKQDRTS